MRSHHPVRSLFFGVYAAVLIAAGAAAQEGIDVAELRRRLEKGDNQGVFDVALRQAAKNDIQVELSLLGSEAALNLQDFNRARSFADLAEKMAPEDPRSYAMNGHALFRMAEAAALRSPAGPSGMTRATFVDAASYYRLARTKGGPGFENAWFEAEASLQGGDLANSLAAIDVALEDRNDAAAAHAMRAKVLRALQRPKDALGAIERAVNLEPGVREHAELLVIAAAELGDRARAKSAFLDATSRFPKDRAFYDPMLDRYLGEKPPAFLRTCLEEALARTTVQNDHFPLWYLGVLTETEGSAEAALEIYTRYRDALPAYPDGWFKLGTINLGLGRLEESRNALMKANALGGWPKEQLADAYRFLAAAYVGRRDQASAAEIERLVVSLTSLPDDELNLGVLEIGAGRPDEGIRVYERIAARTDLETDMASKVQNYLGLALLGAGRTADAVTAFQRSLSFGERAWDPKDSLDARENLGVLLLQTGKPAEGIQMLESLLKAPPLKTPRLMERARYHWMRARFPEILDVVAK